ncbi:MAG: hypothetical protein RMK18_05325, partial [Armatimonadota bacterium]|nr:hypothetical protein [Armatimonadota bacterium]
MEGQEMDEFLSLMLEGVDVEALAAGDTRELEKFKVNMVKVGRMIYSKPLAERARWFSALRAGSLQLIAQIPVITPMLTAILESATGEDLGSKIDALGRDLGDKIDTLGRNLGDKIDTLGRDLGDKIDALGRDLGDKIDTLGRDLGGKIDALGRDLG